jgi:hypothetical protein
MMPMYAVVVFPWLEILALTGPIVLHAWFTRR